MLKSAELLKPFYERLHQHLLRQKILQADETTLNVIQDGRDTQAKSYMWLYQSGGHETMCPIVLYEYQATRAGQHAVIFYRALPAIYKSMALPGIMRWNRTSASWLALWRRRGENLMRY